MYPLPQLTPYIYPLFRSPSFSLPPIGIVKPLLPCLFPLFCRVVYGIWTRPTLTMEGIVGYRSMTSNVTRKIQALVSYRRSKSVSFQYDHSVTPLRSQSNFLACLSENNITIEFSCYVDFSLGQYFSKKDLLISCRWDCRNLTAVEKHSVMKNQGVKTRGFNELSELLNALWLEFKRLRAKQIYEKPIRDENFDVQKLKDPYYIKSPTHERLTIFKDEFFIYSDPDGERYSIGKIRFLFEDSFLVSDYESVELGVISSLSDINRFLLQLNHFDGNDQSLHVEVEYPEDYSLLVDGDSVLGDSQFNSRIEYGEDLESTLSGSDSDQGLLLDFDD